MKHEGFHSLLFERKVSRGREGGVGDEEQSKRVGKRGRREREREWGREEGGERGVSL